MSGEPVELDENGNPIEQRQVQTDPEKEQLKAEIAELRGLVTQMGAQMKTLSSQKVASPVNPNQPQGRDLFKQIAGRVLTKYGADPSSKEWAKWDDLLADLMHETITEHFKELNQWKESATNAIYGIEDEVGLLHFLNDPANAKLDRGILPELRETYQSKQYWKKPDGQEGDWNGWKNAYGDLSKKIAKYSGQPAARPAQPKPTLPGMTFPKEVTRVAPGQQNGSQSSKFLEENSDLAEIVQEPGGSTALLAGLVEEE